MLQINLKLYNKIIDFEMECPWLDERLQSLSVVAHSHAPFVHESFGVAMHYRGIVPLCIVAISFIPPARFHAPFVHALCTFHGSSTLDFHVAMPPSCMFCVYHT